MYGLIASHWRRENGRFLLDVTIPANTTATVYVPAENSAAVKKPEGARFLKFENGRAAFEVSSGAYSFATPL